MRIPQAIFTSLRGQRMAGYQLAAKSKEIGDDLARQLTAWGPAHDSLLDDAADGPSINFHPLGQENFCLSLTHSAGAEYSGRAGARVYTRMFVLSREALSLFDNNPFLILRTIEAAGRSSVCDEPRQRLRSIALVGRAREAGFSGAALVEQLTSESLAKLATTILQGSAVGIATALSAHALFAALFRRVPVQERLQVSFTTGLRFSPRRAFRLFTLPRDPVARRQFHRQPGLTVVEL